jgi:hypothetical protein
MYELLKLIIEHVDLWEVTLLLVVVWVARHPEHLKFIQSIKVGDLEIKIKQLEQEVSTSKDEIRELEQELENDRRLFGDLLEGFDAHSPLPQLAKKRELLKAHARTIANVQELADFLTPNATPEELYAAAVTLRERRPTELFGNVVECLNRLAGEDDLGGIRLNTVWTLTSALHLMLIAAVRDGATPEIPATTLREAKALLNRLEQNPRVQDDRPDKPEKGVRGPIKYARAWIDKGLA